eukprot:CAMPEP_0116010138 /NCGR_PEP_ID=MMETSP0321-20121206/3831_1 /TAXON_ID=163516 /ORGANISM="Leptocylindrus danicus var. danicus, Strain B650" /LENGTH=856 /DNA_ID=CAMNT_0003479197 /DNA_START=168 /DNA_END=2738 /DNA_ORIENTATION=+
MDGLETTVVASRIPSSIDVQTFTSHPAATAGDVKVVKSSSNDGTMSEEVNVGPDLKLPENRYQSLWDSEKNIQTLSRSLLDNCGNGITSMRKLPLQSTNEKKVSGYKRKGSGSNPQRGSRSRSSGSTSKTPLERSSDRFDEWIKKVDQAPISITETWLEVIRRNRRNFWRRKSLIGQKDGGNVHTGNAMCCTWCQPEAGDLTKQTSANAAEMINKAIKKCDPDNFIQCLTCGEVGCGPGKSKGLSHKHIMKHFIITGHSIGITCGDRGALFCMRCGDFVYNPVIEREKIRAEISARIPYLDTADHFLRRSLEPAPLAMTDNENYVWPGLMATYPSSVPHHLAQAGELSLKRLLAFTGESRDFRWSRELYQFILKQSSRGENWCKLTKPTGMINLGNTCYMSSVLQCLFHCLPLQQYFLGVGHHFLSCKMLRENQKLGTEKHIETCLACELDKLFLEMYGNCTGLDVISALQRDQSGISSFPIASDTAHDVLRLGVDSAQRKHCFVKAEKQKEDQDKEETSFASSDDKFKFHCRVGTPIVPAHFLQGIWRCESMRHIAGYEQRDAHEFLQSFLDEMGKHARRMRSMARACDDKTVNYRHDRREFQYSTSRAQDDDIVQSTFEGNLRSILLCEVCGCKRTQPEPFLNVSLPLSKEKCRVGLTASKQSEISKNSSTSQLTLRHCLESFCRPEQLAEKVQCSSCLVKTSTQKQLTFAKLPRVLCLHLKRFDARTNKKLSDPVSFPAELDMGPHVSKWCEVGRGAVTSSTESVDVAEHDQIEPSNTVSCPKLLYDLFGTINHRGSMNQGHYTANVKVHGSNHWYHCNDEGVYHAGEGDGEKEVLASDEPYMLFYIRREEKV